MRKLEAQREFIELRAIGYTYDELCAKLNITKPTSIAWGKKFASQIDEAQNYYLVKRSGVEIIKKEDTFLVYREQFRRMFDNHDSTSADNKFVARLMKRMNTIFAAKIEQIQFKFSKEGISEITFKFTRAKNSVKAKNISVEKENAAPTNKILMQMEKSLEKINDRKQRTGRKRE